MSDDLKEAEKKKLKFSDRDYLLVCVDPQKRVAMRFLSLKHAITKTLQLKKPSRSLSLLMAQYVLGGVLIGNRASEKQSTLFKLVLTDPDVRLNCEVSPQGGFRCAIFPAASRGEEIPAELKGQLTVAALSQSEEVYESIIEFEGLGVLSMFEEYIMMSSQKEALFCLHADLDNLDKNYALWIEKLPGTSDEEWDEYKSRFAGGMRFLNSFKNTDDPDRMMEYLFDRNFKVLHVHYPELTCICSRERFVDAIKILPREDLLELFMQNQGITSQCEYCQQVWEVTDKEVRRFLKMGTGHQ